MSDSLKDQLLALGLAKEKPARKTRKPPRKRQSKSKPAAGKAGEPSLAEAWRARSSSEKAAVEEQRRRKRAEDLRRRQVNAKLQPLIEGHKLNDPAADLKRNFLYKGRIRSVLVTPEQMRALNAGELGLAFLRGSYFLLPPEVVAQVREISPEHVPDLDSGGDDAESEHPVPDDLLW